MRPSRFVSFISILLLSFTLACRTRPQPNGGDGNSDGSGDGGNGGGGGGTPQELTDMQKAAVDDVVEQLDAATRALTGIADSFVGVDANADVNIEGCPNLTADVSEGIVNVAVDFPDGCTNDYFENQLAVSGAIELTVDFGEPTDITIEVFYDDFSTNGQTTTGVLTVGLTRENLRRTLSGIIDIETFGVGAVLGDLEVRFESNAHRITLIEAMLNLTDEQGELYTVAADNLVVEPAANASFVPDSGTVSFDVPNDGPGPDTLTLTIEFTDQSPRDGTVEVTVGDQQPIPYQLPSVP